MNKFTFTIVALVAMIFSGCDKEQDYFIGAGIRNNVTFSATNITVSPYEPTDSATSVRFIYDFYSENYREKTVFLSLLYTNPDNYENFPEERYELVIPVEYENTLWAGGNNDIRIIYTPSCEEEKSATFTMPDGIQVELTRDNPVYIWQLNKDSYNKSLSINGYRNDLFIYATSRFTKDGVDNYSCGYVVITLAYEGTNLYFDQSKNIWFLGNWTN